MVYRLYDILLLAASLVLVPYYYFTRARAGRRRQGIGERLGFLPAAKLAALAGRPVIWVHAVSVGETQAVLPLLRELKAECPHAALVVSNVTETGHQVARTVGEIDCCLFFPFDFTPVVRRVLRAVKPAVIAIVETEIWPNFVRLARQEQVPVVLVNGRISDRSYPRYWWVRSFLRPVLANFAAFCMQSAEDARRVRMLGAPPARVRVTGNLKFDLSLSPPSPAAVAGMKTAYRLPSRVPIWIAGSTHEGEEELVLGVYERLLAAGQQLFLVLVPRHPERGDRIGALLHRRGFTFVRRRRLAAGSPLAAGDVLLVDTVGELQRLYGLADLVFVGGSLVPVGGHNLLEPAALAKPVLFGPHMENFRDISRHLLAASGGRQVNSAGELYEALQAWLRCPAAARQAGVRGREILRFHAGATARTARLLAGYLAAG